MGWNAVGLNVLPMPTHSCEPTIFIKQPQFTAKEQKGVDDWTTWFVYLRIPNSPRICNNWRLQVLVASDTALNFPAVLYSVLHLMLKSVAVKFIDAIESINFSWPKHPVSLRSHIMMEPERPVLTHYDRVYPAFENCEAAASMTFWTNSILKQNSTTCFHGKHYFLTSTELCGFYIRSDNCGSTWLRQCSGTVLCIRKGHPKEEENICWTSFN